MTCIVGIADKTGVMLGADSLGSTSNHRQVYRTPKLFRRGPYLIGSCGSYRVNQLLAHAWRPPVPEGNLDRFLATRFADTVWKALAKGGNLKVKNEVGEIYGEFLVAVSGRLYVAQADFSLIEPENGEAATGSGYEYAHGALVATRGRKRKTRILAALEAAAELEPHVGGPFHTAKQSKP